MCPAHISLTTTTNSSRAHEPCGMVCYPRPFNNLHPLPAQQSPGEFSLAEDWTGQQLACRSGGQAWWPSCSFSGQSCCFPSRMVINTESNILLFQFENIKWQYFLERAKQRKTRDKEDREENLPEVMSKASTPIHNLGSSISNKYLVAQESLLNKSHKSRVLLLPSRTMTGKRTDSQAIKVVPNEAGLRLPGLVSSWDILSSGFLII